MKLKKKIKVEREIEIECHGKYCSLICDYEKMGSIDKCKLFNKNLKEEELNSGTKIIRCPECIKQFGGSDE